MSLRERIRPGAVAVCFYLATMLAASSLAAAETPLTIDQLLAQGCEIAGYASVMIIVRR
jgi:hypothetical protein